jgi:SAM-dependent methyltransferase
VRTCDPIAYRLAMNDDKDTGAALRSLYASAGGVSSIFSAKVQDYAASRPDYPAALFDSLARVCAPSKDAHVADLGAGTGLLTGGLLAHGWRVTAVEPSAAMRAAADSMLGRFDGYRGVEGTAESIPLPDASVDLLTAAQAFHWFDIERARPECLRVLKPQGQVALVWNDRVSADPLHLALDEVFAEFGGARRAALLAHEVRSSVTLFFGASTPQNFCWPHEHRLDEAGLASLVFSRSYVPGRGTPEAAGLASRVSRIFGRFASGGTVSVRYETVAIVGRPA